MPSSTLQRVPHVVDEALDQLPSRCVSGLDLRSFGVQLYTQLVCAPHEMLAAVVLFNRVLTANGGEVPEGTIACRALAGCLLLSRSAARTCRPTDGEMGGLPVKDALAAAADVSNMLSGDIDVPKHEIDALVADVLCPSRPAKQVLPLFRASCKAPAQLPPLAADRSARLAKATRREFSMIAADACVDDSSADEVNVCMLRAVPPAAPREGPRRRPAPVYLRCTADACEADTESPPAGPKLRPITSLPSFMSSPRRRCSAFTRPGSASLSGVRIDTSPATASMCMSMKDSFCLSLKDSLQGLYSPIDRIPHMH